MIIDRGEIKFGELDICYVCKSKKSCPKLARLRSICNGDIIEWKICSSYKQDKAVYLKKGTGNNTG